MADPLKPAEVTVPVVRLSVNLAPDVAEELKLIASERGWTVTDTIRAAISTLSYFHKADKRGQLAATIKKHAVRDDEIWTVELFQEPS